MTEASMTLAEWCAHRRVCRSMFYALEKQGRAPRTHRVGVKRLISAEADAEWLRAREAEVRRGCGVIWPCRNAGAGHRRGGGPAPR